MADQWGEPTPSDYYQMQTACEVRRVLAKDPGRIKLQDFRLKFQARTDAPKTSKDYSASLARAAWFARMTKPVEGWQPGAAEDQ